MPEFYLPKGFVFDGAEELGRAEESGDMAHSFVGHWECPLCGETHSVTVATSEEHGRVSTDQLEEAFGTAVENGWEKHKITHEIRGSRLTASQVAGNKSVRAEVAGALRDWKKTTKRMGESSNGKIHW
tara:strand:- start:414 stop:797 length:384 start_codon:yes stop_codon:yes gene_type:complete